MIIYKINEKINEKINKKINYIINMNDISLCAKGILICIINDENTSKMYTEKAFCNLFSSEYDYFEDLPQYLLEAVNELFTQKYIVRYLSINHRLYIKIGI